MARRSQCSNAGDNPLDPNYLPPHYREEYRLAVDSLVEEDLEGYYEFLQRADVVDFLSPPEIQYIQSSIQLPHQGNHPQHPFLETGGDGSSDTYWPIHSDLDAPGLDLGWPQLHHFGGPAEVTTLVNPPEPDMPSIKEQARRLIKNAQQVIAIVMDVFTDVDIFADLLNAAMRNVAVYILLDEQNVHLFINMVSNCRVNLQAIQFLRVRAVSGITYHCRSGKSFKGQMMDRFILTDCRAVLSGNYSFMWSFEKLHRCMAHLFLGQLVSTFDEEFRILFAQSQPLILENLPGPVEEFGPLQKWPHPSKRTSLPREPKKFTSLDTAHPEDWPRHSYDERMDPDRTMAQLKRHETLHGPADMYGRYSPQQPRMDPHFDQGPSRLAMLENPAFKRHSYAEGGRYTFLQQQQGLPDHEAQGRQFHRGQLPNALPGPEAEYGGYDKFWNQDYHPSEQFSEPVLPQDLEPPDNFDPVLNYLSSTRNVDFDQGMEKLQPGPDVPFGSPYARRPSAGQVYACQTSPTPSSTAEEKHLLPDPNADRKDPKVKRGLRNWRISSYLNTYDNPGDEGLPSMTPQASDPFDTPSHPVPPVQQAAPGIDLVVPKIPNVREFKVPAVPRVSQIPGYAKTAAREQPKRQPEENPTAPAEVKTTPTPSESSSTTDGDKTEEAEPKEPKTGIRREESFRRNYNAAVQRSSRLRSSLIFSSLEDCNQDTKTAPGQEEEDSDQKEGKTTKLPFVSHVLGKRRPAREPFEWSRYIKSSTADKAASEASKPDDGTSKEEDKDSSKENDSKDPTETPEDKKSSEATDVQQANVSPSVPRPKPSESELPKTTQPINPPKSLLTSSLCVDMNDPDTRLMFFKELAAKRKAAKAAEAEKSKDKAPMKTPTDKKEDHAPKEASDKKKDLAKQPTASPEGVSVKNVITEDGGKTGASEASAVIRDKKKKKKKQNSPVNNEPCVPKSCENDQSSVSTVSEKELENSPSEAPLPVSADTEAPQSLSPENPMLPEPAVKECILNATTEESPANAKPVVGGADKNKALDSTSKESSLMPKTQTSETAHLETSISAPALPSDLSTAHASSPQSTSSPTASSSVSEDAGSSPVGPPETIKPSLPIFLQIVEETPQNPTASPDMPTGCESAQSDSASHSISSQITSAVDAESDVSHDKCDGASGIDTSEAPLSDSQRDAPGSESSNVVQPSPKDAYRDDTPPSLSPSSPQSCLPALDAKAEQKKATTPPPVDTPPESTTDFPVNSNMSSKTPESETCESSTSESPVPADKSNMGPQMEISKDPNLPEPGEIKTDTESTSDISQSATQESVCNDQTNDQTRPRNCSDASEVAADDAAPLSTQSKQQKPNQLRYHSSTANVLSSSNLRDDTKLLLEQISANSQSRNEAPKEAPVTDDEKEDEADKNAQREKERGIRALNRGQPKNPEEREKLLERIQSMRKERKVYSRFEMAP